MLRPAHICYRCNINTTIVRLYESVNGDAFYYSVLTHLTALLPPFINYNKHSVAILDNAFIHHTGQAVKAIEEIGAFIHFLPPYPPGFNQIQQAFSFSKLKIAMKWSEETMTEHIDLSLALSAFAEITEDDCMGWINDSKKHTVNFDTHIDNSS